MYQHMDMVTASMDENANLLNSLNEENEKQEKEKEEEINADEGIELEEVEKDRHIMEKKKDSHQPDLNQLVDQISVSCWSSVKFVVVNTKTKKKDRNAFCFLQQMLYPPSNLGKYSIVFFNLGKPLKVFKVILKVTCD